MFDNIVSSGLTELQTDKSKDSKQTEAVYSYSHALKKGGFLSFWD